MNCVSNSSPFQDMMPDEINLNILSFLKKKDLQSAACTCKIFEILSCDFQIWKPKIKNDFGKLLAKEVKQYHKSWRQTYEDRCSSKEARVSNIGKVLESQVKKMQTDDVQYRTNRAAAALFEFPMPNPNVHYYPTGQTGFLGTSKITVYRSNQL